MLGAILRRVKSLELSVLFGGAQHVLTVRHSAMLMGSSADGKKRLPHFEAAALEIKDAFLLFLLQGLALVGSQDIFRAPNPQLYVLARGIKRVAIRLPGRNLAYFRYKKADALRRLPFWCGRWDLNPHSGELVPKTSASAIPPLPHL